MERAKTTPTLQVAAEPSASEEGWLVGKSPLAARVLAELGQISVERDELTAQVAELTAEVRKSGAGEGLEKRLLATSVNPHGAHKYLQAPKSLSLTLQNVRALLNIPTAEVADLRTKLSTARSELAVCRGVEDTRSGWLAAESAASCWSRKTTREVAVWICDIQRAECFPTFSDCGVKSGLVCGPICAPADGAGRARKNKKGFT